MKQPVRWSREALQDLKQQVDFISRENPAAARRVADRIREAANALGDMAIGRAGRVDGTYEKPVIRFPYVVVYTLRDFAQGRGVVILRVIHTARDWPADAWPSGHRA